MNEKHIISQQDDNDDLIEKNKNLENELRRKNDQLEEALLSKVPIQQEKLVQSTPVEPLKDEIKPGLLILRLLKSSFYDNFQNT